MMIMIAMQFKIRAKMDISDFFNNKKNKQKMSKWRKRRENQTEMHN